MQAMVKGPVLLVMTALVEGAPTAGRDDEAEEDENNAASLPSVDVTLVRREGALVMEEEMAVILEFGGSL